MAEQIPAGWSVGYNYLNGSLAAQYKNGTTYFIHQDHLGSTRLMTQMNGTPYDSMDYMPFGEQISGDTGTSHKFEGKERDPETNNDDFGARYYSSQQGRWLTPDWSAREEAVPYATLANPQTLNLYAFVADNPLARPDLDGHCENAGNGGKPGQTQCGDGSPPAKDQAQQQNASQNQSNQQTQSNQQSTSGINPNYKLPTGDIFLKKASDFSAGAGDVLSLGTTYLARKYIFHSDSVVDKKSGAYFAGAATGTAIGAAIGATGAAAAEGETGALFGRGGGFFNRGVVRFGWYWSKTEDAIGLRIGPARTGIHIPFYFP